MTYLAAISDIKLYNVGIHSAVVQSWPRKDPFRRPMPETEIVSIEVVKSRVYASECANSPLVSQRIVAPKYERFFAFPLFHFLDYNLVMKHTHTAPLSSGTVKEKLDSMPGLHGKENFHA